MKRRDFLGVLGGAAAWPTAVRAQQPNRIRRIGMLVGLPEGDPEGERWVKVFLHTMSELGWRPETDIQISIRWVSKRLDNLEALARELLAAQPELIQVTTTPATAAVLRETRSVPTVFSVVSDPVGSGFIQSLARPGSNATGFINIEASLGGKWVELLKEVAPHISRIAIVFNPATAPQTEYYRKSLEAAAKSFSMPITTFQISNQRELEAAINTSGQDSTTGLIVVPDAFTTAQAQRDLIISLVNQHRMPAIYNTAHFVRAGGLVSYGVDLPHLLGRAATYVDRILKGAKPQDLPVQLPTKFELVINVKAAMTLGLNVSPMLLARADEVIE